MFSLHCLINQELKQYYFPKVFYRTSNKQIAKKTEQQLLNTYTINQNQKYVKLIEIYGMYYILSYVYIYIKNKSVFYDLREFSQQTIEQILTNEVGQNNINQFYTDENINEDEYIIPKLNKVIPSYIVKYSPQYQNQFLELKDDIYNNELIYLESKTKIYENCCYTGIYYRKIIPFNNVIDKKSKIEETENSIQKIILQYLNKNYIQVIHSIDYINKISYEIFDKLCVNQEELYQINNDCYQYLKYNTKLYFQYCYQKYLSKKLITTMPKYLIFVDIEFVSNDDNILFTVPYELSFLIVEYQFKRIVKELQFYPCIQKNYLSGVRQIRIYNAKSYWNLPKKNMIEIQQEINKEFSQLDSFILLVKGRKTEATYLRQIGQQYLMDHIMELDRFLSVITRKQCKIDIQTPEIHKQSYNHRCDFHNENINLELKKINQKYETEEIHCSKQDVFNEMQVFYQELEKNNIFVEEI